MKILFLNPKIDLAWFSKSQIELSRNTAMIINAQPKVPTEFFHIIAVLKRQGINGLLMLDPHIQNLSLEKTAQKVAEFNPDLILIPSEIWIAARCNIPFLNHVTKTIEAIRNKEIKSKIVVSGSHGTIFPEKTLRETGADIVIQGEPEMTFVNIANNLNDLKSVKGICFFDKEKFIINPPAELVNMSELPAADYSIFPVEKYFSGENLFPVISSRGCIYSCSYCSSKTLNKKYRERKLEDVFRELDYLAGKGLTKFTFPDEIFTVNRLRTLKICDFLEKNHAGLTYTIQTRSEFVDDEIMSALKRSGCTWIGLGFESAAQEVLDRANKNGKVESVEKAIALGKKYGITMHLFAISLLPGETKETISTTMSFFRRVKPESVSMASATPIPGTKLWEEGIREGKLKGDSYEEALEKNGMIGNDFSKDEVKDYNSTLPVKLSFSSGKNFMANKIKQIFKSPKLASHYIKKFFKFVLIKFGGKSTSS
ncbi:B12-binding domain-containing radical SAM protein [Candidatus Micrarchaeota archaeon]|nr:B12-binding domain-containing radical SAM protein [Candidatus Micrarchaeota archaeon]MBU2476715.1 B12-binding domain-containing radical SAM protein [Candidatus Micrarchaeota archaeon]